MDKISMQRSPVVVFVYNRLEYTIKVLEALDGNDMANESVLFIFSDGAKDDSEKKKVLEVRSYLIEFQKAACFKKVIIKESELNKGLAASVIDGVSKIISEYGKAIVVEDDCVPAKDFLRYMNNALIYYQENANVWSISGYAYQLPALNYYNHDVYMFYRACSWGWGTWRDRWETVDWEVNDYKEFKYSIRKRLRFKRGGNDLPSMLKAQMNGKIDSWAIRWCFEQSKRNMLTVYPKESRIINIGFDNGTHGTVIKSRMYSSQINNEERYCNFENVPLNRKIDLEMRKLTHLSFLGRITGFVKMEIRYIKKNRGK